ncbi:MAG: multidrug transporter [Tannerella sp.]|jgi:tetratricopeptide (TPR) repeat protein|nr:multidrug transporter [Tannerella sp.]
MENIAFLLERFLESQKNNTAAYFDVDEIISLIDYFLDKDDMSNLKTVVELGHDLHPDDVSFRISLCRTLMAIEDFGSALKLMDYIGDAQNESVDLMRIECYCELGRCDEALDLIDELTAENSPYLEEALVQAVCVMNDMENLRREAGDLVKHALTMFPDSLSLKSELCFNLELQGKTKEALTLCRELINEDPYSAETWYMQGRLYSLCADFERSVDSLDFALTCIDENEDPELEYEIKLMKAYCLYKNESYDKAISVYEELTGYDDFAEEEVEPFLAECYMGLEEYEEAYRILKRIADLKDLEDDVSVHGNLIYCCIETERRKEAIDLLGEMLKRFPGSILEYLSALNMTKDELADSHAGKRHIISDLARTYLGSNLHNN